MATQAHFRPALFRFLRDLRKNNDREWFKANRERYEQDLKGPALDFISDFEKPLHGISAHFLADPRPVGGSLFRIHRDTRFSADKTPYKTQTGIQFRHRLGKDAHAPCFYLHLGPKEVFVGAGIWHPDTAGARLIRQAIVEDPKRWKRVTGAKRFRERFRLGGDSLKRPPREHDADHPLVEDLKRKDFIAITELSEKDVTSPGALKTVADRCRAGGPFVHFLCDALGAPF